MYQKLITKTVTCKFCNKEFKHLGRHLKYCKKNKDNIFGETYKKLYKTGLTFMESMAFKTYDLYFPYNLGFPTKLYIVPWYKNGKCLTTSKISRIDLTKRTRKYKDRYTKQEVIKPKPFMREDVLMHFFHGCCIGYDFEHNVSPFLCFDIDRENSQVPLADAEKATKKVLRKLRKFFPDESMRVEFSGSKGYHIWIFFDTNKTCIPLTKGLLARFAKFIIHGINVNGVNIEHRPENASGKGKGIMLPLGKHRQTGAFQCFIDTKTFLPLSDSYASYLSIVKYRITPTSQFMIVGKSPLKSVSPKKKQSIKISNSSVPSKKKRRCQSPVQAGLIKNVYENGLFGIHKRNPFTFLIALYLREIGCSIEESITNLYKWTEREYKHGRTKDSAESCKAAIEFTVEKVHHGKLTLSEAKIPSLFIMKMIEYTLDEYFANIKMTERQKKKKKTYKNCLITIFTLAHYRNQKGFFFINIKRLSNDLKCCRRTIERYIAILRELKIFVVARKGIPKERVSPTAKQGYVTLYYSPFLDESLFGNAQVDSQFAYKQLIFNSESHLKKHLQNGNVPFFFENLIVCDNASFTQANLGKYQQLIARKKKKLLAVLKQITLIKASQMSQAA